MNQDLLHPKICPVCGGKVEYTTTKNVYGRVYGSGYCYHCTQCGAATTTHKSRPEEAVGILADQKTKNMRTRCHNLFDKLWRDGNQRREKYKELAQALGIDEEDCHFGYMDYATLVKAQVILKKWWFEKYDI